MDDTAELASLGGNSEPALSTTSTSSLNVSRAALTNFLDRTNDVEKVCKRI